MIGSHRAVTYNIVILSKMIFVKTILCTQICMANGLCIYMVFVCVFSTHHVMNFVITVMGAMDSIVWKNKL